MIRRVIYLICMIGDMYVSNSICTHRFNYYVCICIYIYEFYIRFIYDML